MRIAMISDVHEQWHDLKIPECDVLISAGDYSYTGKRYVVVEFHKWLSKQNAENIISVQGNHELWVEKHWDEASSLVHEIDPRIWFVDTGHKIIDGVSFFCSAVQPEFGNWAWNKKRGPELAAHWARIPSNTEVLVTHGPPYGVLDVSTSKYATKGHLGCKDLLDKISYLDHLKLHVFGHIHGSSGEQDIEGIRFVNAAICDEDYLPFNPVRIYDLET